MSIPAFGLALDPMRPSEITPPPGLAERPPYCPECLHDVLLYPGATNGAGDMLFACANDGYEAVYRAEAQEWTPRPGRECAGWRPPLTAPRSAPGRPQDAARVVEVAPTAAPAAPPAPEPAQARTEPVAAVAAPAEPPRPPILTLEAEPEEFERVSPTED